MVSYKGKADLMGRVFLGFGRSIWSVISLGVWHTPIQSENIEFWESHAK